MNLPNNQFFGYFTYLALLTIVLAVLAKFDRSVTVQVTPLSLRVEINDPFAGCAIEFLSTVRQIESPTLHIGVHSHDHKSV
ncbi:hypothetical protein [Fischerella sp. JS2]|uniref:hypothetical protein n=1 Tax=Fischerella sp. JS2 TaxID=2597771 RepID=UPI0028E53889|nr:hypothetical protein [Fischerella sp. JS2]